MNITDLPFINQISNNEFNLLTGGKKESGLAQAAENSLVIFETEDVDPLTTGIGSTCRSLGFNASFCRTLTAINPLGLD